VIEAAGLRGPSRSEAEEALSRKDEGALARLAGKGRGSPAARKALPSLATLYGEGALTRARALARGVPGAMEPLAELEAALRLARRRGVSTVEVDLGEVRGLGYYTGITFAGYAAGAGAAVASGGRYDGLLARFGRPGPAIGFAVDLEFATQALERRAPRRSRR
jgi:ATP phosphoribosyltransferase regulatory subunit